MGLDMYLDARIEGTNYNDLELKQALETVLQKHNPGAHDAFTKTQNLGRIGIVFEVGYWRKANAIHNWFVQNVQEGNDNCQEFYVSRELLAKLKQECEKALETKDTSNLQPKEGFFFGGTGIDEWYWKNIQKTIAILSRCLDITGNVDFYYRSSW